MNNIYNELKYSERITLELRRIYESRGYTHFRMSKFEPYDLYARNKDFLTSDEVLTFTDYTGKLLALKPDVTMSIIKNSDYRDGGSVEKYYYNENVYRVKAGTHSFGELLQTGVECIGEIDAYDVAEVVIMAVKSLAAVSDKYVLDVSDMGIVSSLLAKKKLTEEEKHSIIKCIGDKSAHGIADVCRTAGVEESFERALLTLVTCGGALGESVGKLKEALAGFDVEDSISGLESLLTSLDRCGMADHVRLDFSVVYDRTYYNGIVFRGFVEGVPERVLSGGRYDLLLRRMGKRGGGIGFAVYVDTLERLEKRDVPYTDVLVLTTDGDNADDVAAETEKLIAEGKTVLTARAVPHRRRFGMIMKLSEGKLTEVTDI